MIERKKSLKNRRHRLRKTARWLEMKRIAASLSEKRCKRLDAQRILKSIG
jgi:hypothetical protein